MRHSVLNRLRLRTVVALVLAIGVLAAAYLGNRRHITRLEKIPPIALLDDKGNKVGEFKMSESSARFHGPKWIRFSLIAAFVSGAAALIFGISDWAPRHGRNL
jgi:hypothetical protein